MADPRLADDPARTGGRSTDDVPPPLEAAGIRDSGINVPAPRPLPGGRRPMRRTFLAPVIQVRMDGTAPVASLSHEVRYRERQSVAVELPPPVSEAAPIEPAGLPPVAAATPRRRRLPLLLACSSIAAVLLAAGIFLSRGDGPEWVGRVRLAVAQKLAGPLKSPAEVPSDPAGRLAYYSEHARAGDTQAQVDLAVLYAKGDGVGRDYAAAAKWFRAAAEKGLARAQYDLGVLYERGRGVPLDTAQATGWYRKAAEQNHPLAEYNLAVAYTKGDGVNRDFAEAAIWYRRAAAQGVIAAMVNLAILYERGEGLDVSPVDAYAWYRAAARRGSQPAAKRADELLQAFSPSQQTLAETRTADIAATIRDPVGERMRAAANGHPAVTNAAAPGPVFRSGMVGGGTAPLNGGDADETN